uniref:Uncharacterized protein U7 n=1 Tax=Hyposoter didymator TaxID=260305 RepID=D7P5M9_HYPDD|nr:unknown [Hyposoter didymator]
MSNMPHTSSKQSIDDVLGERVFLLNAPRLFEQRQQLESYATNQDEQLRLASSSAEQFFKPIKNVIPSLAQIDHQPLVLKEEYKVCNSVEKTFSRNGDKLVNGADQKAGKKTRSLWSYDNLLKILMLLLLLAIYVEVRKSDEPIVDAHSFGSFNNSFITSAVGYGSDTLMEKMSGVWQTYDSACQSAKLVYHRIRTALSLSPVIGIHATAAET